MEFENYPTVADHLARRRRSEATKAVKELVTHIKAARPEVVEELKGVLNDSPSDNSEEE